MEAKTVTKLIDAISARTQFGKLMEEAEKGETRFLVSRRGKPKVVILGVEDYLKNVIKQPEILTTIQLSAKKAGLDKMSGQEIEAEISAYRRSRLKKVAFAPMAKLVEDTEGPVSGLLSLYIRPLGLEYTHD